jgi:Zn-finger nucleic acid-binding protein
MLIGHADLIGVLETSWHAVPQDKAEGTCFCTPEGWRNQPSLQCPDCHQTMEKNGYMGLGAIQINRCDPCAEIWLDTDELQNMVLALAKSNCRSEADWEKSKREEMDLGEAGLQAARMAGPRAGGIWLFDKEQAGPVAALSLLSLLLRLR